MTNRKRDDKCYVCDSICFTNKSSTCADDRLSRPGKEIGCVLKEFQSMKQGTDYTWKNPWSPEINPFMDLDSALKYASGGYDFKTKKRNDGSIVVISKWGNDLYFFYRIRQLSDEEIITIVKLYKKHKNNIESLLNVLGNLTEKINKING